MNIIKKLLRIPTEEVKTVEAVELWEVRWQSRKDVYSHSLNPEAEMLTSKQDAEDFATALRNAFKLTRNTSEENVVTISKRL